MKNYLINFTATLAILILLNFNVKSQDSYLGDNKPAYRIAAILSKAEDSVMKQFKSKNLVWPPSAVYVRSFKYDRQLEVWVKDDSAQKFVLFKTYKICMQSGTMGPKRMEGDYQVPEGFYHINEFNPNSNYHLSLGLNYPNASDRILSDSVKPGGAIYIHGNCVSTGCIPISDEPIEELYIITGAAKAQGQEFIPVHIFPIKYNVKSSLEYLNNATKDDAYLQKFNKNIKEVFDYFEKQKELPVILINRKGEYVIN
jgi:murein L,D-transpeptidase YafK